MKMIQEIEGYVWSGEKHSWIDTGGKPASRERGESLDKQAKAIWQVQMMERLESARAAFDGMSGTPERKAALLWLGETYRL